MNDLSSLSHFRFPPGQHRSTHSFLEHSQLGLSAVIMLNQDFIQRLRLLDLDDVSQYIRNVSTPVLVSVGALAAATTYFVATRPKALPPVCDLRMQSIEIPVSFVFFSCSCWYSYSKGGMSDMLQTYNRHIWNTRQSLQSRPNSCEQEW